MPVIDCTQPMPQWCQASFCEAVTLEPDQGCRFKRMAPREALLVAEGRCEIVAGDLKREAQAGTVVDVEDPEAPLEIARAWVKTVIVRVAGQWDDPVGEAGVLTVDNVDKRKDIGLSLTPDKTTGFECHYHDCQCYWIALEGEGTISIGDEQSPFKPGQVAVTPAGVYHDILEVQEPMKIAMFQTTLTGQCRTGSLVAYRDGQPEPAGG
jgi:mannose-6-phosphate isomerase-like protein (cupin superfamily)